MTDKKVKLCEFCGEQPATVLCAECCKCLCDECNEYTHKKASMKRHKTETIPEGVIVDARCSLHNDEPLSMFCVDEVKMCCSTCASKTENLHKGHNVVKISDIIQDNEVFSVSEARKRFADVLKCDDELDKKIEETIESIKGEDNNVREKIKESFTEAHNVLKDKEAKAMEELEKAHEELREKEAKITKEHEKAHKELKEEEVNVMKELERVCTESEEILEKNLDALREVREYSKLLSEADAKIRGDKESSRLMELNLVSSMEEQRRTMEELHKTMMTDLKVEWDSDERKLSFTRTLFNGVPIPSGVSFSSVLSQGVSVSWTCDESKLSEEDKKKVKYFVEMKKCVDEKGRWKEVYSGTDKKCDAKELEIDTEYNVRVMCAIGELQGKWSNSASVRTKNFPAPTFFTTRSDSWDSITLTWNVVENASHYQIETDGNETLDISINTTFTKSGLPPSTEHTFRVRSICEVGVSGWSVAMKGRTRNLIDSIILPKEENDALFEGKLSEWCKTRDFELLYRGTRDGFGSSDFHRTCDNKGKTLVLIKNSSGHIFGGFASIPWTTPSSCTGKQAPGSFIFTLTNMYGIQPTKFNLKNENDSSGAVHHDKSYISGFGNCGGKDIDIYSNCNTNTSSYSNFPYAYNDATGKGNSIFSSNTSDYHFKVQEVEVFRVNV